jgi:hypothetical protein
MRPSLSRSLVALACLLTWASPSQAAVACSSVDWAFGIGSASTTVVVTFPSANGAGDFKGLAVFNRSDATTTISTVAGSVDASGWTIRQGPTVPQGGGQVMWWVERENASAGTETVTVTFSGAINSQAVGGWCTGVATASAFDASAAVTNFTASTNWDSNTASATAAGGIFGMTVTGTNSITWTIEGAGESQLNCAGFGQRVCVFFEPYASGGSYGFELTPSSAITGSMFVNAYKEPGGAPSCTGGLLLLGAGKCEH